MKLNENKQFLRKLLQNFPNGSVNVFDRELRYVLAEGKGLTELGLSPEGIVGKTLYELFDPELVAVVVPYYQRTFAGEECEFELPLGGRAYKIRAAPIEESEGQVNFILALAQDVTEDKRRERNTALFAEIGEDFMRLSDPAEVMSVIGAKVGAFLNLSSCAFNEIFEERGEFTVPYGWFREDAPNLIGGVYRHADFVTDRFHQASRAGETVIVRDTLDDTRIADPAAYDAIKIRSFITVPFHREGKWKYSLFVTDSGPRDWRAGEVEFIFELGGCIFPRLERALAEADLRESKARFDLVKNSAKVGFWFCNLPFDKLNWDNRVKEHFWLPPDAEVTIDTFYEQLHPDDRERTRQAIDESIANRTQYEIEYRTLSSNGREKWIRATGRTFYDAQGRPIHFDGVTIDVTERRRNEEALREADRRKDEFLAMLAHELRSPLAPILNAVEILNLTSIEEPNVKWSGEVISRQVSHLTRLVDDLLDISRITRGKIALHMEMTDLMVVLGRALETSRPLIDARKQELALNVSPGSLRVEGDVTRLAQVVSNLLNNASKYSEEGGHIELSAGEDGEEVIIRVRDDGIGISPETLPNIFELFVQAERSLDRAQGGLGIGLTLVKRVVGMHGGRVEAFSDGPGKGSEFVVRLPAALRAHEPNETASLKSEQEAAPCGRILVVDDNVDSAASMAMLLKLSGHEVQTANDGPTAITLARTLGPEVIILDIGLPGMNGYEVARQLQSDLALKKTVLIAVTGYGQAGDRAKAKEAGFDYHLTKPVDHKQLSSLLKSLILH
jgi:PAS domain S-box-containing protein